MDLVLFFIFLWLHTADEFPVCQVFSVIVWDVPPSDKRDCVDWVFMHSPIPFARRPNSFADDVL